MSVVENTQHNMTIIAYAGNNCIINSGNSVIINGQVQPNGNNYIYNYGANVGMLLGTGADTVENHGGAANINVGGGNNYVISEGDWVTIIGSDGADTVGNLGNSARINLGSGKNSVGNAGNSASIASGGGDDTVINQGSATTINTGAGNDQISNNGANAIINSDDGNDNIDNRGTNAVINSGANNDTVGNFASNVKVNLGAGEDVFINYVVIQVDNNMNFVSTLADADKVTINGEDGGDVIENYGGEAMISGGAGGDAIYNYGISVVDANGNYIGNSYTNRGYFIDGGDANDYIYNENSKATITGGAHNDTIINVGSETSLNGGTGADSIYASGNTITILGGAGTDTISLDPAASNVRIIYNPGDGNDLIMGFNSSTTLVIGNGSDTYSSQKSGDDVIVMTGAGGDGRITLQGAASLPAVNIEGVYFDPLIIIGSDGDDNVAHWGHGVSIEAGKGNDNIYFNGNNISVNGGEDKDTIVGNGNYATIEGGGDDDEIYHSGSYAIITGGKGKDLISLNSAAVNNLIRYALNDDNDLIYGFNETSTLQITNGQIDSVFSNGFDDFLIVGNQAIKLVSTAWIRKLNVVDADGKTINLGTIAINGTDDNDSIVAAASGKLIIPGAGNDYIFNQGNYITVMSGTGNKTIELEGDNNRVNLGNGIHIVSLGGSGSTVTPDDSNGKNSNTLIQGGIVYIDESGIDNKKLPDILPIKEEDVENIEEVKDVIKDDPVIKDILKNGPNSEYLGGLSPEKANENVAILRGVLDSDIILDNLRENGTAQDYRNFLTQMSGVLKQTGEFFWNHSGEVLNINTLLGVAIHDAVGVAIDAIKYAFTLHGYLKARSDFYKKLPDEYKKFLENEDGNLFNIHNPIELRNRLVDVNHVLRSTNKLAYDEMTLKGIDELYGKIGLVFGIGVAAVAIASGGTLALPAAGAGLIIGLSLWVSNTVTKTDYLTKVHPGERGYLEVFINQLMDIKPDQTFNYRSAPQIIYNTSTQAEIWTGPPVNYNTVPLRSVSPSNAVASYNAAEATSVNVALLTGGAGNDSFSNEIENTSINASAGNDTIMNSATNVTINAGADDDLVRNTGANVNIVSDSGNNSIENSGANVTITTGAGNDVVKNSEVQRVTISTGGGDDYVENFGSFTSVAAGAGADYILSFGEYNTLDAGAGSDTIHNFSNNTTVKTGDDNNLVENIADYVELTTSNGNNTINNGGYFVKIETGSGKDVIENIEGKNVSILSGGGDDYIENLGDSNSIVAGSGNDYIFSSGDSNTIIAGSGNDIIDLEGDTKTKIFYTTGDGNDFISGFNATDTLLIGDGTTDTYSKSIDIVSGNVFVSVGTGVITLDGAVTLDILNIEGKEISNEPEWTLNGTIATYGTSRNTLFTLYGLNLNVKISELSYDDKSKTITLSKGALGTNDVELLMPLDSPYKLQLGSDVVKSKVIVAGWHDKSYYPSAGKTAGYELKNNNQTLQYISSNTEPAVTITGLKSGVTLNDSNISVANGKVTIKDAGLLTNGAMISASNNYTVELASTLAPSNSVSKGWDGTSYYSTGGYKTAGWTLDNDGKVTQVAATNPTVTVTGLKSGVTLNDSNISVANGKVTIKDVGLLTNGASISASNNYTVELANTLNPKKTAASWGKLSSGKAKYTYASTTEGYTLANNKVSYTAAVAPKSFTVSGIKSTSGIKVNGTTVTLKAANLNKKAVTISDGYTLKLADDVTAPVKTNASWSPLSSGKATYNFASTTAGYSLANNKVSYTAATAPKSFTLSGIKSTSGITVDGSTVTLKAANLNKKAVTISDGYTLKLADDVTAPVKTNASWSPLSSGKATYNFASTTAGYSLANNKVSYTAAVAPKSFTVSGIKSTSGIKVNGTTVTLKAANLNKKTVKISDGYNLKLGSDVTAAVESSATLKNGKYTTAGVKTTGYKLANNKISYLTKNLKTITFSGLASGAKVSDITVSGKKITLSKNAIPTDGTAVSVKTSGYTLATDNLSEVIISDNGAAKKANYYFATSGTLPTGYIKTTGSDKKTYYVQKDAKFNQAYAEYGIKVRVVEGTTTTYMTTAPSGYTTVIDANGTFYTNAITMNAKLTNAAAVGKNLVLTAGKESLTVSGAAKKTVEVTANGILYKAAEGLFTNTSTNAVTITENYDASKGYTASASIKSVSATKVKENIAINGSKATKISITGGSGNDSLTGGKNNDTLNGGAGNDTLTGGKGKDLFIYSGGNDVITDYAAGDRISIGAAISKSSVKGSDATFTTDIGTLTVKNGKGKELSFIEADGTARTIVGGAQLFTNSSSAKVTLSSGIEVGDASERTKAITLTGNSKANTILGGDGKDKLYGKAGDDKVYGNKGNDTLWGGAGNDTLYGGGGKDTFIYKPGEGTDTIFDYQSGDMLQILKSDGSAGGSFTKSSFSDGKLTLTVSGGGKIVFGNVNATDTFNINGATYKISGKALK